MHSPFPKVWKPNVSEVRPKVYIPLLINRPNSVLSINAYTATLKLKDESLYLSSPGTITVEFIPKTDQKGSAKRSLDVQQRKYITVFPEEFVRFWDLQASIPIVRDTKDSLKRLALTRSGTEVSISLSVQQRNGAETETREERLRTEEHWLVQEYIKYAIPLMSGWFGLGDLSVVEQNLVVEQDALDGEKPTHGQKDHKCDEHCDHKH